jgi:hypothetical protein
MASMHSNNELEEIRQLALRDLAASRAAQERWDDSLRSWGMRARPTRSDESYDDYRRNMSAEQKKRLPANHELRRVKYWELRPDAFNAIEPQLMRAVADAGNSPDSAPDGQLRMITDPETKVRTFVGRHSFVRDHSTPARLVLGFRTSEGMMNTSGRYLHHG